MTALPADRVEEVARGVKGVVEELHLDLRRGGKDPAIELADLRPPAPDASDRAPPATRQFVEFLAERLRHQGW